MPDSRRRARGLVNRLARPLLAVAFIAQIVVPLARIATSYRATEAALSPALILVLSSVFALLPALLAVSIGRYNDRHGSGHAAIYGSLLLTAGCMLLFLPLSGMAWLLLASILLGVGQTLQLTALQAEVAAMRSPAQRERMIGGLMLWQAVGQVGAPLMLSTVAVLGSELTRNLSLVTTVLAAVTTVLSLSLLKHAARPKPAKALARIGDIVAIRGFAWIVAGGSLCVAVQDLTLVYLPVVGEQRGIPPVTIGIMLAFFAVHADAVAGGLSARCGKFRSSTADVVLGSRNRRHDRAAGVAGQRGLAYGFPQPLRLFPRVLDYRVRRADDPDRAARRPLDEPRAAALHQQVRPVRRSGHGGPDRIGAGRRGFSSSRNGGRRYRGLRFPKANLS